MRRTGLTRWLLGAWLLDRLWKQLAIWRFFRRRPPPEPATWPSLTLLQPITHGVTDLRAHLLSRLEQEYAAYVQHVWICDAHDQPSQAVCAELRMRYGRQMIELVRVDGDQRCATKIEKLLAGLPHATGAVLVFVDDDVMLRPGALQLLVRHLLQPQVGAVFGLACYTNWRTPWSSLMSAFVNLNVLLSYIPLAALVPPYTITGHCFALQRHVFEQIGGLTAMAGRIDDDHELARRVLAAKLANRQTPLIYDVDNDLPTLSAYLAQMQRWFVLPRQCMLPQLTPREQAATLLTGGGQLVAPLLLGLALLDAQARRALLLLLGLALAQYRQHERAYLKRSMPPRRWWALAEALFVAPLHVLRSLGRDEVLWRGQRWRVHAGGRMEELP